jgi:hypothetical protein
MIQFRYTFNRKCLGFGISSDAEKLLVKAQRNTFEFAVAESNNSREAKEVRSAFHQSSS